MVAATAVISARSGRSFRPCRFRWPSVATGRPPLADTPLLHKHRFERCSGLERRAHRQIQDGAEVASCLGFFRALATQTCSRRCALGGVSRSLSLSGCRVARGLSRVRGVSVRASSLVEAGRVPTTEVSWGYGRCRFAGDGAVPVLGQRDERRRVDRRRLVYWLERPHRLVRSRRYSALRCIPRSSNVEISCSSMVSALRLLPT